jgi:hypothetical protein
MWVKSSFAKCSLSKMQLLRLCLLLLIPSVRSLSTLLIHSPDITSIFAVLTPLDRADVPVNLSILNPEEHDTICMNLESSSEIIFSNQCLPASQNSISLRYLTPATYTLTLFLKDSPISELYHDAKAITFRVVLMETLLPTIKAPSEQIFVANTQTDASDVVIEYELSSSIITSKVSVCIDVSIPKPIFNHFLIPYLFLFV